MEISGKTELLAVVGKPIRHSLSPKLHNFLSQKLNLDYVYTAFEPQNIPDTFKAIRTLGIKGVNVTAPYKYDALANVDVVSENARFCGSVNTVVNNNGVLTGYSTDGDGLYMSMKLSGIEVENKKILVLGAGGASKPICVMLKQKGAESVYVKNRTVSKAEELCRELNDVMNTDIFKVYVESRDFDIIINTTSVGMGTDENPLDDMGLLDKCIAAVDIVYHPRKTAFMKSAEAKNVKAINGLGMLVFQGIIAYEYFTGVKVPEELFGEVVEYIDE